MASDECRSVFISYSHQDSAWLERLKVHLKPLASANALRVWDDTRIPAGCNWTEQVRGAIENASVAVVLVSADLLASDFVQRQEIPRLCELAQSGKLRLLWVLVTPCGWAHTRLASIQCVGPLGTPLSAMTAAEADALLTRCAEQIASAACSSDQPLLRHTHGCPYRGLSAFREEDAPVFFGRDKLVRALCALLESSGLTAVVGPSGSGKSSLVQAGLFPYLRGTGKWATAVLTPGDRPYMQFAASLTHLLDASLGEQYSMTRSAARAKALRDGRDSIEQLVHSALHAVPGANWLLVVIDQFEELLTLTADESERMRFISDMVSLSTSRKVRLVLTLRSDFYGQAIDISRDFADALSTRVMNVGGMNRSELRDVIVEPALRAGRNFDDGLVERILDDVGQEPGVLPLLEFSLTELWNRRLVGPLTHRDYDAIGGVRSAIARRADALYNSLSPDEQMSFRTICLRLVRVAASTEEPDTRQRVRWSELDPSLTATAQDLIAARLVVSGQDLQGEITLDLAHEALIRHWDRLEQWLADDRHFLQWRARLRRAILDGLHLRGQTLKDGELYLTCRAAELSSDEREWIDVSLEGARHVEETERTNERLRQFAYIASHDLQEPLRTVASYVQLLARRYGQVLGPDGLEFVNQAVSGVSRMHDLLNGLLTYTRVLDLVEGQSARMEPVDVAQVVAQVMGILAELVTSAAVPITYDELPIVLSQEWLLRTVLQNLLVNAIKFRREDGPVIRILAERQGSEWVIAVEDNGIGFDPQYGERIFEPFKRLHGRELQGSGLGLAIARKLVEFNSGKIWAESAGRGCGATFRFTLPAVDPNSP